MRAVDSESGRIGLGSYFEVLTISTIYKSKNTEELAVFRQKILDWYDKHRRVLPWRALPGEVADPYRVWLSEVMLQQTTVTAVIPYFLKFTQQWPDVHALAHADNDMVMSAWAGLGYYARARNLHKCAKIVSSEYGGVFPQDQDSLKKLPGIGDYTSAAITAIAFDKPATVVDGNVERVMARYYACAVPLPAGKKALKAYAHRHSDGFAQRSGDYAQSLMDLGATICTPKSPVCALCPLNDGCLGYAQGEAETFPRRSPKIVPPKKHGYVYWIKNMRGDILLHKRPEKGLLGGMYGLPTSAWGTDKSVVEHIDLGVNLAWQSQKAHIVHVFTHFHLTLDLYHADLLEDIPLPQKYEWFDLEKLKTIGMPTVFKKAIHLFK